MNRRSFLLGSVAAGASIPLLGCGDSGPSSLLNASYDATRELYRDFNRLFAERSGHHVLMSHGGSSSQARSVIDGMPADIVTLAIWPDIQAIQKAGLIDAGWENEFENQSLPFTSTIVFLVRKGNPHAIQDWPDLIDKPVRVIAANPKTSGSAKLAVMAAWGAAKLGGWWGESPDIFLAKLFKRVPALESSSRSATVSFARKRLGDVLITWETDAWLALKESRDNLEIVYPSRSIRAEPQVALVDGNLERHAAQDPDRFTRAKTYLQLLYDVDAQRVIASHHFRPIHADVLRENQEQFARICKHPNRTEPLREFTVSELFKQGWQDVQSHFFDDGALFDRIYSET